MEETEDVHQWLLVTMVKWNIHIQRQSTSEYKIQIGQEHYCHAQHLQASPMHLVGHF